MLQYGLVCFLLAALIMPLFSLSKNKYSVITYELGVWTCGTMAVVAFILGLIQM